jgi:hypothetical protein
MEADLHLEAYVALSRATSLEGLEIVGFDPSRFGINVIFTGHVD